MLSRLLIRSRTLLVPLVVWSIVRNICDGTVSYSLSDIYRGVGSFSHCGGAMC